MKIHKSKIQNSVSLSRFWLSKNLLGSNFPTHLLWACFEKVWKGALVYYQNALQSRSRIALLRISLMSGYQEVTQYMHWRTDCMGSKVSTNLSVQTSREQIGMLERTAGKPVATLTGTESVGVRRIRKIGTDCKTNHWIPTRLPMWPAMAHPSFPWCSKNYSNGYQVPFMFVVAW